MRSWVKLIFFAVLLFLTSIAWTLAASADTTITVTNTNDSGAGSLRQSVSDAVYADTTIVFDNSLFSAGPVTIALSSTLAIDKTLTIDGESNVVITSPNDYAFTVNDPGNLTLQNLTVADSKGGIYINSGASLTVSSCTFSGNSVNDYGGGIYNHSGALTASNCTFSGNSASHGGGIYNFGTANVSNCTFFGNTANYGRGFYNSSGSPTLTNCILWDENSIDGSSANVRHSVVRGGYSGTGNISTDPLLGSLGDYGGPVATIPLLPGSPAINAGTSTDTPTADARGTSRVGSCDMGAFESQGFTLTASGGTPQEAHASTAFADPLSVSVTANAAGEPVDGGQVTFMAPATDSSASFTGNPAVIVSGVASVTATANSKIGGPYNVTASAAGADSVSFNLTNTPPEPDLTLTGHTAGNLGAEIDAYMSANGISSYGDITGLSVSGGTINNVDRVFLYSEGMHSTLKTVDFSGTNIDYTGVSDYPADNPNELPKYAFGNWTAMTSIVLPDSLAVIKGWAFSNCPSLETVYFPSGLTYIDYDVFHNSSALKDFYTTSATPPDYVSNYAFDGVADGAVIHVPEDSGSAWDAKDGSSDNGKLYNLIIENMAPIIKYQPTRISDSTAEIIVSSHEPGSCYYAAVKEGEAAPGIDTSGAGEAFDSSNRLTMSLTGLEPGAYGIYLKAKDLLGNVSNLIKIDLEAYVQPVDVVINNHETGKLADEIDGYLSSLSIPNRYEKIQSLKASGGSLDSNDWDAFCNYYAYAAQSIDLSGTSSQSIPDYAFEDYNITDISLPSGIESIGAYAFAGCGSLADMTLPSSTPPTVGEDAFYGMPSDAAVHVPAGSAAAYKAVDDGNTTDDLWYGLTIVINPSITTGSVSGTVTDGTVPVAGAVVSLTVTGSVYSDVTAADGSYIIQNIPAGTDYTITATKTGYISRSVSNVTVTAGETTSNVDIALSAIQQTYTVTFDSRGGSPVPSITNISSGSTISTPRVPTRSGYIFKGWYKESACTNAWNFSIDTVTSDITLYAGWSANPTYTVTFKDWDGTVLKTETVEEGTGATAPGDPSREGYTFTGWDKAFDNVTSDLTVTAQYCINTYTVSFNVDGGSAVSSQKVNYNGKAARPADPAKDGYTFTGWYSDMLLVTEFDFNTAITANIVIYAKWTKNPVILLNIAITTPANKLNYTVGDSLDISGMVVTGTYSDGSTKTETVTATNVSGFTSSAPAVNQVLTVTVGGKTATYTVTIKAAANDNNNDNDNDSGGGGGSSTPADNTPTVPTPPETPKTETTISGNTSTATTTTTATVDSSGNAAAAVTQAQVGDAVRKAVEEAAKQGNGTAAMVEIKVEARATATAVETSLPKAAMDTVAGSNGNALIISTPIAVITFDAEALDTIAGEAAADVKISVAKVDAGTLSNETKQLVGDRPVYNFSVTSGGKTISQFGGNVSVSAPYTPKPGEDTNAIVIYYINAEGKPEIVSNCAYDPATSTISFTTNHFSRYAVGYNKVSFKDVPADAWYGKAVSFIAARGITTGTGSGSYSPDAKLTKGEFMVMMMRACGIEPDASRSDNFADAGSTYYTGYLAAAKRLGISGGTGNNMFAPDKEITRQEMFTLLYNALKTIGQMPAGTSGKQLSALSDAGQVASWAKDAMKLMAETGIINGSGGKLSAASTTTRAEMAQVLYNLLSKQITAVP